MARRAKKEGLKVLVDLHYSDFWADPGKQWTPAAWEGQSFDQLTADVHRLHPRHRREPRRAGNAARDDPARATRSTPGLLWDYSATWTGCSSADDGAGGTRTVCHTENWDHVAQLLTAGYGAVKSASPSTKVMLHLAEGGDNGTFRWWFDNVTTRNVPFDVIGASFYGYWHGTLAQLQFNLNDVATHYGKDVVVAETAYPFTLGDKDNWENIINLESELIPGYPATPGGPEGVGPRPDVDRARRPRRSRARHLLLGRDLDRRGRQRLEPARPGLGQRVGEPGALRLQRPVAAGDERVPAVVASLSFEDVGKTYPDGTRAVIDLTLAIEDGEFIVLVGPSGCGKTTALRMVAGLEEITEGVVLINDTVVNYLPARDRDVAMVFQNYALYPQMSVFDNIGFGLKMRKMPKPQLRERVLEIGRMLGLEDLLDRKPANLSGGQRQRVAMGRAIARQPQLFLMDEPLSNLDAKLRVHMRAEIARLQRELGVTTLYVTHDQVEAMTMGGRIAVMRRGELQQFGSPQELYDHPVNLFVASFLGSPVDEPAQGPDRRRQRPARGPDRRPRVRPARVVRARRSRPARVRGAGGRTRLPARAHPPGERRGGGPAAGIRAGRRVARLGAAGAHRGPGRAGAERSRPRREHRSRTSTRRCSRWRRSTRRR